MVVAEIARKTAIVTCPETGDHVRHVLIVFKDGSALDWCQRCFTVIETSDCEARCHRHNPMLLALPRGHA